jgi:ABC-2 type transport system ATP-binding protein
VAAALAVDGVCKRYRGRVALDAVSFRVEPGVPTALLGVNGAGKSTLFRAILDLVPLDAGRIAVFGDDHRRPRARRPLAYLGERFVPPPFARGRDVLAMLLGLHGQAYDAPRAAAECARLELDPTALARPAREYSKGMLQKLGLIACLLVERPLLLLDEPLSGLDPQARAVVRERLRALRDGGTTVLFSTHALRDVEELCARVLVLHGGRLCFDGEVAALAARDPAQDLERSFLSLLSARSPA